MSLGAKGGGSANAQLPEGLRQASREAILRAEEERYEALFQNIPLMYFTLDDEGVVRSVNCHGAAELGYQPEELVGESVLSVFHPEDRDAVMEQLRSSLENPERVAGWEFRKVRKDGSVLWVKESVRTVRNADGRYEVLVACQDVTEQKQVEQKMRRHEERLRALTSALSLAEERERRRLAIGVHDRIGGTLAAVRSRLAELRQAESVSEVSK